MDWTLVALGLGLTACSLYHLFVKEPKITEDYKQLLLRHGKPFSEEDLIPGQKIMQRMYLLSAMTGIIIAVAGAMQLWKQS